MRLTMKIVAGIVLALVANGVLSDLYRRGPARSSGNAVLDAAFYEYPHDVEILLVGNSHIGSQVDPRRLGPEAFSLTSPGESYIQTYYRLRYVLEETEHAVDTIVLPASLHCFNVQQTQRMSGAPWPKYLDYWEIGAEFGERGGFAVKYLRDAFAPYTGRFEDFLIEPESDWTIEEVIERQGAKHFSDRPMDADTLAFLASQRVQTHFWDGMERRFWFDERVATYLEKILELAGEHEIRVVLVRTPVSRDYWRLASDRIDVAYLDRRLGDLIAGRAYVTLLDYHDLYYERPELFYDGDHLGETGNALFTEHLRRALDEIRR